MEELYIKKYWQENNLTFYIHFNGDKAMRQIEVSEDNIVLLLQEEPVKGNSVLYDQSLGDLELQPEDYITEAEFNANWNASCAR